MLRKKLESESGTEITDSGFLIIYEKLIRIAIPDTFICYVFEPVVCFWLFKQSL